MFGNRFRQGMVFKNEERDSVVHKRERNTPSRTEMCGMDTLRGV